MVFSELALRAGVQSVSGTRLSFSGRPEGCHCITGGPCTDSHRQEKRTKVHALFEIGYVGDGSAVSCDNKGHAVVLLTDE